MPAASLEALFAKYRPGATREQLAEEAGLDLHKLNYLFRPRRANGQARLPAWDMCVLLAKLLKCPVNEVVLTLAKADGIDLETDTARDEQELLADYRALSRRDQRAARAVIHALGESL